MFFGGALKSFKTVCKLLLISLLTLQPLFSETARASYAPPVSTIVPNASDLFGIPEAYFNQSPENLPEEYKQKIAEQMGFVTQSAVRTYLESLFLIRGLYLKVKKYESENGIEALIDRVSEKKDMTSLDFDYPDLGVAELKSIGYGADQRLITTVRHNSGHYFMFVDRSQFDIDFLEQSPQEKLLKLYPDQTWNFEKYEEELNLRKTLSGVLRLIASRMLLMGDRSHLYIPISGDEDPKIRQSLKSQVDGEMDPISLRYQKLEARLRNNGLSVQQREGIEAEKRILERELLKKMNLKTNIMSKIVQYAIMNLGSQVKVQGFEVTVVMHNDGNSVQSATTESQPRKNSLSYWEKYWEGIYERPHVRTDLLKNKSWIKKMQVFTKGDLALALATTSAQVSLSLLTAGIGSWMGIPGPDPAVLALNSLVWGLGVGIIVKTFVNWTQTGSSISRSLKNSATGVGFGYTQFFMESLFGVGNEMVLGDHTKLWATQFLKGPVKVGTQEIPKFRKKTGDSAGNLIIRGYDTEIRKMDFETQVIQLILFVPKLSSLFLPYGLGIPVYMMMGPLGKLIHLSHVEKYAKAYEQEHGRDKPKSTSYRKEANGLREEWETLKLWDRVWLDQQVNQFDERVQYWCDLIEERSIITGVSRFRVKLNKSVGGAISTGARVVITVSEFVLSRYPAYYILPLFKQLKSWRAQVTVENIKNFPSLVQSYLTQKGAVWIYKSYRFIEVKRQQNKDKSTRNSSKNQFLEKESLEVTGSFKPAYCRSLF